MSETYPVVWFVKFGMKFTTFSKALYQNWMILIMRIRHFK